MSDVAHGAAGDRSAGSLPDGAAGHLALLQLLARWSEAQSSQGPATSQDPAPASTPEPAAEASMGPGQEGMRAVALPDEDGPTVDVFALTVEVLPDLSLAWDYFGPNSHVIFGEDIKPHQPPTDLLLAHTHAEDQPAVRALLHAFRGGTPVEIQFRIVGRDSTLRWVAWRCVPRRDDGRLLVDAVATDVSARHKLGELRRELLHNQVRYVETIDAMRDHATLARDANDNVLQRLFAAGLRLRMLHKRLHDVDAHAAAAIAFQLDEAANDLRAGIHGLNHLLEELASTEGLTPAEAS